MPPKKRKAAAHKLAPPMKKGTVLTDMFKKQWVIGDPLGQGGFGLIYKGSKGDNPRENNYAIKIEPHSNGPLFCEVHFYSKVAKEELVKQWLSAHKDINGVGVPLFIAHGSHTEDGTNYRFLVMPMFAHDLQKMINEHKTFPRPTVAQLAIQIISILEYLHDHHYCHADIKAANLLMGGTSNQNNQVYLVDYGLATRFKFTDGKCAEYKENPQKAHDGTIEFTSRDAHKGVAPSPRGDMEILAYCLLQWSTGTLPWMSKLHDKPWVSQQKHKHMSDLPALFRSNGAPQELRQFFEHVTKLKFSDRPDYNACRNYFRAALKSLRCSEHGKLVFASDTYKSAKSTPKRPAEVRSAAASPNGSSVRSKPRGRGARKTPVSRSPHTSPPLRPSSGKRSTTPVRVSTPSRGRSTPVRGRGRGRGVAKLATPVSSPRVGELVRGAGGASSGGPSSEHVKRRVKRKRLAPEQLREIGTQTTPGLKRIKV